MSNHCDERSSSLNSPYTLEFTGEATGFFLEPRPPHLASQRDPRHRPVVTDVVERFSEWEVPDALMPIAGGDEHPRH